MWERTILPRVIPAFLHVGWTWCYCQLAIFIVKWADKILALKVRCWFSDVIVWLAPLTCEVFFWSKKRWFRCLPHRYKKQIVSDWYDFGSLAIGTEVRLSPEMVIVPMESLPCAMCIHLPFPVDEAQRRAQVRRGLGSCASVTSSRPMLRFSPCVNLST